MTIEFMSPDEEVRVRRKSSISQHKGSPLAVWENGEWLPISFDYIDAVSCDGIKSHRVVIVEDNYIGYHFPVGRKRYVTDEYILEDNMDTEFVTLDEWFGTGIYERADRGKAIINADNGALGEHTEGELAIGLDYVTAMDNLEVKD